MKYLIGTKQGMTQTFLDDGRAVPVTVVEAGPCHVTAVKTQERDGYSAVQLGYQIRKKLSKPETGHVKQNPKYGILHEFPQKEEALKEGDVLSVTQFAKGDKLKVSGVSKGKGFQGVVKRHGFGGSPKTHGHKDQLRMPGSIGAGGVQHVFKNTRMAGHMGADNVSVNNLEVVEVLPEEQVMLIKGALPGPNGSIVFLQSDSTSEGTPLPEVKTEAPAQEEKPEVPAQAPTEAKEEKKEAPKQEAPQEVKTEAPTKKEEAK